METEPYHLILLSESLIKLYPLTLGSGFGLLGLVTLLFLSALVSGSEVAFFSLSPNNKEEMIASASNAEKGVMHLLERPNRLLATILIANNFINIAIVILSTYLTSQIFDFSNAPRLGFAIQVVVITFLLILFGEIIPKIYASANAIRFSKFMNRALIFLTKLFWPFSNILLHINKRVKKYVSETSQPISMKDLSHVLEITEDSITEDKEILEGIVKFGKTFVKEVMKSRVDMVAVDMDQSFEELMDLITKSGYSRIPVFSETHDDIKGLLYVKDLLPHLGQPTNFRWQALVKPAFFVPESKKINELLKEFQSNKIHMALVIDEYGGTLGLITLEDILEEIVGEIVDETDEEKPLYKIIGPDIYLFEAKVSLNDFYKITDVPDGFFDNDKGDAETLAGLILELEGEIPDKFTLVKYKNFEFEISDVDNKRIRKIKVKIDRSIDMEN